MKWLQPITLLAAGLAVVLSLYSFLKEPRFPDAPSASTPEALVKSLLRLPQWDVAAGFFIKHRGELVSNAVIVDFFEANGVGIAFVRTKADGKTLHLCRWMQKTGGDWYFVPYLHYSLGNSPVTKWIKANEEWLQDMEERKNKWEEQSDDVWLVEETDSPTSSAGRADQTKRNACLNNLRQINANTQQYMLENNTTTVPGFDMISSMFQAKKIPTCPAGGTYTQARAVNQLPTCSLGKSHKHQLEP